jgi:hypothetical protein
VKQPRPISIPAPGPGYQPVRFLQPFLLGAFENAGPGFLELLEEQVRYTGANPKVKYDMNPNPVIGPEIKGLEGSIFMQETYLSYLWGVTYAALVIYDEMLIRPRITPAYARSAEQQTLINDAVALLGYALSLYDEYTHWPLDLLPNPERYDDQEAHYVEKADAVFVQATAFILVHEYAHRYLGHLEDDELRAVTGIAQSSEERQEDEYAADRFAVEMMLAGAAHADKETSYTMLCGVVVGLGAILLPHPTLDGGVEHPDPHLRLQAGLSLLGQTSSDNLWGMGAMMLSLWTLASGKPPVGGHTYDSLQSLFSVSMNQLNDSDYHV